MKSYGINTKDPQVKIALNKLGISASELKEKPLSVFMTEPASEEIASMKYMQHIRKLKKTTEMVKELLKKNKSKKAIQLNQSARLNIEEVDKVRTRNKKILEQLLENSKLPSENKSSASSYARASPHRHRIKEFEQIQRENYKKILKEREEIEIQALKDTRHPKTLSTEESQDKCKSVTVSRRVEESEEELTNKLIKYNERMKKSDRIHKININQIKALASKSLEKVKKARKRTSSFHSPEQKLLKIIQKQNASEEKRKEIIKIRQEKINISRQKNIQRQKKAALFYKQKELIKQEKALEVEKKISASSKAIEKLRSDLSQELELRQVFNKLKTEDIKSNSIRNNLILVSCKQELQEKPNT